VLRITKNSCQDPFQEREVPFVTDGASPVNQRVYRRFLVVFFKVVSIKISKILIAVY
jgi:hypothetical protein